MRTILFIAAILCVGCAPKVVYRIPPEKQADAAALSAKLTESLSRGGGNWSSSPDTISRAVRQQVEQVYGEPVKP